MAATSRRVICSELIRKRLWMLAITMSSCSSTASG
jgi:hypothetical protein